MFALTETTTVLLACFFIHLVVRKDEFGEVEFWIRLLFLNSVMAVTKPVYIILVYINLIVILIKVTTAGRWRHFSWEMAVSFILAVTPLLVQLAIVYANHGMLIISDISSRTFHNYFWPKVYGTVFQLDIRDARLATGEFTKTEKYIFLFDHFFVSTKVFLQNIFGNIVTSSNFIDRPYEQIFLKRLVFLMNTGYFVVHIVSIVTIAVIVRRLFVMRSWLKLETLALYAIPSYMLIFSSGITFWTGDRILIPAIPFWIAAYGFSIRLIEDLRRSQTNHS